MLVCIMPAAIATEMLPVKGPIGILATVHVP